MSGITQFKGGDHQWFSSVDVENIWTNEISPCATIILAEPCYALNYDTMARAWVDHGAEAYVGSSRKVPKNTENFVVTFWKKLALYRLNVKVSLQCAKNAFGHGSIDYFRIYGNGLYKWRPRPECEGTDTSCGIYPNCENCNDQDGWLYCEGDTRVCRDFFCYGKECIWRYCDMVKSPIVNCNDLDGWNDTGDTKWIEDPENKCKEKEQKEQEYQDWTCSNGECVYSVNGTRWIDTGNVRNKPDGTDCGSDYYDDWEKYCKGDEVWKHRLFHDFYCEGGTCTEHTSWVDDQFVENCNARDGWYDTGDTKWIEDPENECKEKEQKEQELYDYACSGSSCVYNVNGTRWEDTGNVRNKPDGVDCGYDYYDDEWVNYCKGDEVWKHRLFHDFYCEGGACTDHTSWVDDKFVENCKALDGCYVYEDGCEDRDYYCSNGSCSYTYSNRHTDGWYCNGDIKEYRDYSCSDGSCTYTVTSSEDCNDLDGWYCNGNIREYRDYSCSDGSCTHTVTSSEDCNDLDGWYCNGNIREYRDYSCFPIYLEGRCTYTVTSSEDCNDLDGWYCNGDINEYRDYSCSEGNCTYTVTSSENCNARDGCYPYDDGCEERDYYCSGGVCKYSYHNRHTDGWYLTPIKRWIDDPENECKEKEQIEQEYRDYLCASGIPGYLYKEGVEDVTCTFWVPERRWNDTGNVRNKQDGEDCGSDYYEEWVNYCKGDEVWMHKLFHDFYCVGGRCTDHKSWKNDTLVKNCNDDDGWYDTGATRWIDDPENECKEKEQKQQQYLDFTCSRGVCSASGIASPMSYIPPPSPVPTPTPPPIPIRWVDTGNERNKPDGTVCGCTVSNTLKECRDGTCIDTGICNSTICEADVACDGKRPGEDCEKERICNANCKCIDLTGTLAGVVSYSKCTPDSTDCIGTPVEGAIVTVAGKSDTSDKNGRYNIPNVPAGTHEATCEHKEYGKLKDKVTISGGQTTTKDWNFYKEKKYPVAEDLKEEVMNEEVTIPIQGEIIDHEGMPQVKNISGQVKITESKEGCVDLHINLGADSKDSFTAQHQHLPVVLQTVCLQDKQEAISGISIDDYQNGVFVSIAFLPNGDGQLSLATSTTMKQYNVRGIIANCIEHPLFSKLFPTSTKRRCVDTSSMLAEEIESILEPFTEPITTYVEQTNITILPLKEKTPPSNTTIYCLRTKPTADYSIVSPPRRTYALFHEVFFLDDEGPDIAAQILRDYASDIIDVVIHKNSSTRATILNDYKFYNIYARSELVAYQISSHGRIHEGTTQFQGSDGEWFSSVDVENIWTEEIFPSATIILAAPSFALRRDDMAKAWVNYGAVAYVGSSTKVPKNTEKFVVTFWDKLASDRWTVSDSLQCAKDACGSPSSFDYFRIYGDEYFRWPPRSECDGTDTSCGIYPNCENCNDYDGCYAFGNGCEERDYYCYSNEEGCKYTFSNRHTDGWYDTGTTRWIDDPANECKEKEQKEQEYRDYTCSGGSCVYNVTDTRWNDTGNVRNKPDGTDCGSDYYDDWEEYCKGDEVWKHRLFHDFYCEGGTCTDHTSWMDNQFVENCNDRDGWYCNGDIREFRDYSCSEGTCTYTVTSSENCNDLDGCYPYDDGCEERDYYCSGGVCKYSYHNRHTDGWYLTLTKL